MQLKTGTLSIIDSTILNKDKKHRDYIGCSSIGDECERKIFFQFRFPKPVDNARVSRIFELGNVIEEHVIKILRESGFEVFDKDEKGNQYAVSFPCLSGHIDGVITGLPESKKPHLLEIKSYKDSRFKTLMKEGVRVSDPKYYAQVNLYMEGMGLDRCLFVAYNKDTSEIYCERVEFCPFESAINKNKAVKIFNAKTHEDLDRCASKETDYRCKFCNYTKECWYGNDSK